MTVNNPTTATGTPGHRLAMLDGWRAISILLVMAGHMVKLGPDEWELNYQIPRLGMAIFFTLSGFLIVSILLRDRDLVAFAVRRFARVVPLAWLVLIVVMWLAHAPVAEWRANLLFYANLPPFYLTDAGHFWSLCVEVQFYVAIGLTVAVLGQRGLWLVPVAAVAVTAARIALQAPVSIVTWVRVDEILAGGTLALLLHGETGPARRWLAAIPFPLLLLAFCLSGRGVPSTLGYLRPYLAALLVGVTIVRPIRWLTPALVSQPARYVAGISYALYVFHPFTVEGWFGTGHRWGKYAKRPLSLALSFGAAHLSTRFFERPINRWAHRVTAHP